MNRIIRLNEVPMAHPIEPDIGHLEQDALPAPAIEPEAGLAGVPAAVLAPFAEPLADTGGADESRTAEMPVAIDPMHVRIVEALLFAAAEPLDEKALAAQLPSGADVAAVLAELASHYEARGVNLVKVAGKWQFRTASDLAFLLRKQAVEEKRLSRAAIETLAIISYHQPVTRAEIEDIRGVAVSKGTLDALLESGWVRIRGRRRTPGRPVTYGTTDAFLTHFGLEQIGDLPGLEELKAAGFLENVPPSGFMVPQPSDALAGDEDPYEEDAAEAISDLLAEPLAAPPD